MTMLSPRKTEMLLTALLEMYPEHRISGYLMDVSICCGCLVGTVYKHYEYQDGALFLSEAVTQILAYDRRYLIETADHQCFLAVNFHTHGGRQSLEHLLTLFKTAARLGSRYCLH
jgi:hypothetical protein